MRYGVTGSTGFVGGELVRQLRAAGHSVTLLVRAPSSSDPSVVRGDLSDAAALDRLCADVDGLFHVAGWYKLGTRDPDQGRRVNVDGTRNVLDAARRSGVRRVVYTSTLAVNSDTHGAVVDETYHFTGRHLSVYDETKAVAHEIAVDAGAIIAMPGLVYGPGDTALTGGLIRDVVAGRRVMVPAGGGVCWGYVEDIAAGHVLAMDRGVAGESYMLAGPRAPLADGLRRLATLAGKRAPIVLPRAMVAATAPLAGLLRLRGQYAAESFRASLATYYGTPEKAQRELGWQSRPLDDGLRATIASLST
jgi:nucleoside-diphosphate-sugar epimerase